MMKGKEGESMATITLRMDDAEKKELDEIVSEMGLNLSAFFGIYTKRVLRDRRIPFQVTAAGEAFDSPRNQAALSLARRQIHEGKVVTKSMAELEAMAQ